MRKNYQSITLACDFETTVYEGQDHTEVWASACVECGTENVKIFHSIGEQFDYFKSLNRNLICYYHNLKFDGNFWLWFLAYDLNYQQAYEVQDQETMQGEFLKNDDMPDNSYKYMISHLGQWYSITIKTGGKIIEIRDSLKLLPFTLKRIGQSFKTKHQKLEMEYTGYRFAGCEITKEEQEYIRNDVLVLKEALEIMFSEGHNKMTIGSCCLSEYKKITGETKYDLWFPDLSQVEYECGDDNNGLHRYKADEFIRKSYKGGWCYLVKGKENKVYTKGVTADVNSLYPSMMSSESGNYYPVGEPTFWVGNYIPIERISGDRYYFVHFRTRFYIKDGYLPFVQIKDNLFYRSTEMLETSDVLDTNTGRYISHINDNGVLKPMTVELTMTCTDWILLNEHYDLYDLEIIDGCWFEGRIGIFDEYIEKYKQQKMTSKGARRELAKLFLNNLYGKMASGDNSSFKYAYKKDDGTIGFVDMIEHNKKLGFIPVGSAITSYARNFTIRTAQKNYHGVNERGFIYADTDSIHCDLDPSELVSVPVHDTEFCHWKLESLWDRAYFVRQKTYIEHIVAENLEPIEQPYYNIKCAGMPAQCKELFIDSLTDRYRTDHKYTKQELDFIVTPRDLTDFKVGLTIPSKLLPKRIRGGVLLCETYFTMLDR